MNAHKVPRPPASGTLERTTQRRIRITALGKWDRDGYEDDKSETALYDIRRRKRK
jgi:hypothetical protein